MKKRVLFSEDETQFGFVFNNVYTYSFDAEIDGEVELEIISSFPVEIHYIEILAEAVE